MSERESAAHPARLPETTLHWTGEEEGRINDQREVLWWEKCSISSLPLLTPSLPSSGSPCGLVENRERISKLEVP